MLRRGRRVGPYKVVETIAHGGMSTVYLVLDKRDGSHWALKVLALDDPGMHDRFKVEADIQARLEHPNVVRARELVDVQGRLGIVMDYVDGPSLDRWLHDNPDAPFEIRHSLALQIAAGVGKAHEMGMIHRDLKPGNVMIAETDDGLLARVTDFGLAKELGSSALTASGVAMGTPRYMAPEQIRDAKNVDHRADVFALGALLYELYAGTPAFQRMSIADAYAALFDGDYVDPSEHGVPEVQCVAIRAALEVEPDDRLSSCEELIAALKGEWDGPTDVLRSPPAAVGWALALGLLVLALGVAALWPVAFPGPGP
ncbi:MAG: serine/threonine protein kinase [Myxococcales bacterium]|nr:serine/threonine protein kinase [Myxococcales bacterium]